MTGMSSGYNVTWGRSDMRQNRSALYRVCMWPAHRSLTVDEGKSSLTKRALMTRIGTPSRIRRIICELNVMRRTGRRTCRPPGNVPTPIEIATGFLSKAYPNMLQALPPITPSKCAIMDILSQMINKTDNFWCYFDRETPYCWIKLYISPTVCRKKYIIMRTIGLSSAHATIQQHITSMWWWVILPVYDFFAAFRCACIAVNCSFFCIYGR